MTKLNSYLNEAVANTTEVNGGNNSQSVVIPQQNPTNMGFEDLIQKGIKLQLETDKVSKELKTTKEELKKYGSFSIIRNGADNQPYNITCFESKKVVYDTTELLEQILNNPQLFQQFKDCLELNYNKFLEAFGKTITAEKLEEFKQDMLENNSTISTTMSVKITLSGKGKKEGK